MKYSVFYPTSFSEIQDICNANLDVCITLENGTTYTLVFITPKNLEWMMKKDNISYVDPYFKFIVVDQLDENIINAVIRDLVSNECLLREYGA